MAIERYDNLMEENAMLQKKLEDIREVLAEKVESKYVKEPYFKIGYIKAIVFKKEELARMEVETQRELSNTFSSKEIDWTPPRFQDHHELAKLKLAQKIQGAKNA